MIFANAPEPVAFILKQYHEWIGVWDLHSRRWVIEPFTTSPTEAKSVLWTVRNNYTLSEALS
jgi:hypothetical protein